MSGRTKNICNIIKERYPKREDERKRMNQVKENSEEEEFK